VSKNLRYLGVIFVEKLSYNENVEMVAKKASNSTSALVRLMPKIGGPCRKDAENENSEHYIQEQTSLCHPDLGQWIIPKLPKTFGRVAFGTNQFG